MGITIEFYSADPQELVALFSEEFSVEEEHHFFEKLKTYPVADFSFHLLIPDDLDRLCQSVRKHHPLVPPTFRDLLKEQVWYDGMSESLTVIADRFAVVLAGLGDQEVENIAQDWGEAFHYQEPLHHTPAYQALLQLREVAEDAVARKKSLNTTFARLNVSYKDAHLDC